jgi:RNA polymerase sigma-70 factor (ECF subfamily)
MHASLDDPLEALISSERRTAVLLAVEKLNESDREILKLSYVEGLSGAEIGRRMGLSEGNVRVRRHRALQKLSESLGVTATPDRGLKE